MHNNAQKCKNSNAFLRSQTIFLQKIQIVCGIWIPGIPAFRMFAWQVVLRGHFKVLVSLPFQKYKHVGPICNKAVFVYLCIYMPWVKAIDH